MLILMMNTAMEQIWNELAGMTGVLDQPFLGFAPCLALPFGGCDFSVPAIKAVVPDAMKMIVNLGFGRAGKLGNFKRVYAVFLEKNDGAEVGHITDSPPAIRRPEPSR